MAFRARLVLMAGALVAALAADVWYDVLNFWVTWFFHENIYFPLFFLVAFAVFSVNVARRTRMLPLSSYLDGRHALKARLSSAVAYGRAAAVPAELREAQARETLRAVDFRCLRAAFRFRPWGALALLAAGACVVGWLMHRYPDSFKPRNLAFRQGRVVFMTVKNLGAGGARDQGRSPGSGDASPEGVDGHPLVVAIPEKGSQPDQHASAPKTQPTPAPQPPPGRPEDPRSDPGRQEGVKPDPERTGAREADRNSGRQAKQGVQPGPNEGGALGRPVSLEETKGVSLPTERPESGLAAGAESLRGPGSGAGLPPLPFVRLLGGGTQGGDLFDPETLNIVLEAYPPKYREQLESYLKALQTLGDKRDGS